MILRERGFRFQPELGLSVWVLHMHVRALLLA
jgi:hypothetical protein